MLNTALAQRRRHELGLTLEQVAAMVGGGITRQAVSGWETGAWEPGTTTRLQAYARALGVSLDDLLADPDPEAAKAP